jgi:hypothetical protein
MRSAAAYALIVFTVLFAGATAMAQTALTRADRRALRQQDAQECRRQAEAQIINRWNLAEFLKKCMADRQGQRREVERQQAAERRRIKRGMAAEKRADCNRQANEQRLRLGARRSFIASCVGS